MKPIKVNGVVVCCSRRAELPKLLLDALSITASMSR